MKTPIYCVLLPTLALCGVLPAQAGEAKPKQAPSKQEKQGEQKDDKATAKDPAIQAIDKFIKQQSVDKDKEAWKTTLSAPPQQKFEPNSDYYWHVDTTAGALKIRYHATTAPMHVTSGIYLARLGYYDGLNFHRIITNFMAQGGCPFGRGNGGPGYFMDGEFEGGLKHDKPGLLSMANTGRPMSDGSQFFLTFVPTPWLDGKHTIWGEVVEGMDTLKTLEKLGSQSGKVDNAPKIVRTWITVVPKAGKADKDGKAGKADKGGKGDAPERKKGEQGGGK